jgi:hypothetical protein
MSDIETVEFKLTMDSVWWKDAPNYEILIDDDFIEYGQVTEKEEDGQQKVISFSEDLEEGEHYLKIRLLGKTDINTQVDDSGKILKDQLLNLKQVEIDEIELDYLYYSSGEFYRQTGTSNGSPVFSDTPTPEKYQNFGFNGEWRLKFSVPTYMWFLENL